MLKVAVLIETRAGRREQHGVAGLGVLARPRHGLLHVVKRHEWRRAFQRLRDAIGGGTDGEDVARLPADQLTHALELAGLVLTSEDEQDARRCIALEGLEGGV